MSREKFIAAVFDTYSSGKLLVVEKCFYNSTLNCGCALTASIYPMDNIHVRDSIYELVNHKFGLNYDYQFGIIHGFDNLNARYDNLDYNRGYKDGLMLRWRFVLGCLSIAQSDIIDMRNSIYE